MKLTKVTLAAVIVAGSVIVVTIWILIARARSTITVQYILPDGYRGVFKLMEDQQAGVKLERQDHRYTVHIPKNGILSVKSLKPLRNWHAVSAAYESGKLIPVAPSDQMTAKTVALYTYIHSTDRVYRFFVGTQADELAISKMRTDELDSLLP